MAGTFTQNRAEGQLPNAKGTLYTTPALTKTLVKSITLVNDTAGTLTANIYFKNATSRKIIPKNVSLVAGAQAQFDMNGILLAGDLIEGDGSAATSIDYWISLIEET